MLCHRNECIIKCPAVIAERRLPKRAKNIKKAAGVSTAQNIPCVVISVLFAYFFNTIPIKIEFVGFKERFGRRPFEAVMLFYLFL